MKTKSFLPGLLVLVLATLACQSMPPREIPVSTTSSILAVDVRFKTFIPLDFFDKDPARVYFIKAPRRGDINTATEVLPASWIKGSTAYLLNPEPGDYYVVAADWVESVPQNSGGASVGGGASVSVSSGGGFTHSLILTEPLMRSTKKTIGSGQAVYMGVLAVAQGDRINADTQFESELQKKISDLVRPGASSETGISKYFTMTWKLDEEKGNLKNDETLLTAFRAKARADFAESPWAELASRAGN